MPYLALIFDFLLLRMVVSTKQTYRSFADNRANFGSSPRLGYMGSGHYEFASGSLAGMLLPSKERRFAERPRAHSALAALFSSLSWMFGFLPNLN